MIDRPLQDRISAILRSGTPESATLDYKAESYPTTEGGRKEFAKDISAFANRDGGLLMIGVRESAGVPAEIAGVPTDTVDSTILWLESVARSGVSPHILGLRISSVPSSEKQLIVVDVPSGSDRPYEVPAAGARFFVRDERSVRQMSREEIKFAVRREADLGTRISEFANRRWELLLPNESGYQGKQFGRDQGGCQLIVCPIFEQTFTYHFDTSKVFEQIPYYMNFTRETAASAMPQLDGLEYRFPLFQNERFHGFVKLYRHGAVEIADGYVMDLRGANALPGALLMHSLLQSIGGAVEVSHSVTGAQLYWIEFRVLSRPGTALAFFPSPFGDHGKTDRSHLLFDPIQILYEENFKDRVPYIVRPLLDQIWQAFGYVNCGYFDQNGIYKRPR